VADVAALMLGATPVSIYNSSAPDQVEYLVNHSGPCSASSRTTASWPASPRCATSCRTCAPARRGAPGEHAADFTWDDLVASEPIDLEAAAAEGSHDDLVTIIYTSGTTGPPRA
jgi:long-chain acyl-CoA synthetase